MTNTTVTRKVVGTAAPRHFNKAIAEAYQANMDRVGLPQWTAEEQTFAKAVQKLAQGAEDGLATKMRGLRVPAEKPESGGSDDIGNVSWVAPTAPMFYPANIPNLPGHNWANAISMATPIAHKGVLAGTKVMALTLVDFITRPELVTAAKTYFTDVQMKSDKPQEFLADGDEPQVQINRETMARYRPEMKKFYYDAARYDTYLEQLGVKFPQLTKP
jgi:aminobenzoyl-glutamate utilization protein B